MTIDLKKTLEKANSNIITQKHIKDKLGVSWPSITYWMSGKFKPNKKNSKAIEDYFRKKGVEPIFY